MPAPQNLRATGDRIEQLLDDLEAGADPRIYDQAAEILRLVVELYGAGLTRMVELARERDPGLVDALAADELVASLLLVHGLHPESLPTGWKGRWPGCVRCSPPTAATPSWSASTPRPARCGCGCSAAATAARPRRSPCGLAVEQAIVAAAPEIVRIEVDEPSPPVPGVPVAIGAKPAYDECPAEVVPS